MSSEQPELGFLRWNFKSFRQDLEALPPEAFDKCFGGKARTVADFVHETNLVNDHIRLTVAGEELFDFPDGWIYAPENLRSKDAVLAAFDASAASFLETMSGFSAEQMAETIMSDDKPTTRSERCRFVTWHLGYHSGQLKPIRR